MAGGVPGACRVMSVAGLSLEEQYERASWRLKPTGGRSGELGLEAWRARWQSAHGRQLQELLC